MARVWQAISQETCAAVAFNPNLEDSICLKNTLTYQQLCILHIHAENYFKHFKIIPSQKKIERSSRFEIHQKLIFHTKSNLKTMFENVVKELACSFQRQTFKVEMKRRMMMRWLLKFFKLLSNPLSLHELQRLYTLDFLIQFSLLLRFSLRVWTVNSTSATS